MRLRDLVILLLGVTALAILFYFFGGEGWKMPNGPLVR